VIIKVCGMRDPENMLGLQQVPGVQWMGLIFHPASPRSFNRAHWPASLHSSPHLSPLERVGVFVNQPLAAVRATARNFALDRLQLHGDESLDYCRELAAEWPLIKAFRLTQRTDGVLDQPVHHRPNQSIDWALLSAYGDCCTHLLFDTAGSQPGGNGQRFDWSLLQHYQGPAPFLLAGGLGPAALDALLEFQHPYWAGIDLNSGFEIRPGLKDLALLREFVRAFLEKRGAAGPAVPLTAIPAATHNETHTSQPTSTSTP
jgi:phosphoribosylanthranilate isomerase